MQVRPFYIGLAVAIAAAAFCLALTVAMVSQPFHRGMIPPLQERTAHR